MKTQAGEQTTATASYNAANQVTFVSQSAPISYSAPSGFVYDNGGNVTTDGVNNYAYDSEGRLCAVQQPSYNGGVLYRYIYDASGLRVAKGTFTGSFPTKNTVCPAAVPGTNVTLTAQYLLNLGGEQVTELNGTGGWVHSNVWAGSHLDATYDTKGLHFQLADPLGTRRVQTNYQGVVEEYVQSLPFGDNLNTVIPSGAPSTADDATEHHFTGKERDAESGNDYFFARYYGSNMGRFMSPDPSGLSAVNPSNPQTWNLYVYALNNPLAFTDPTGLDCVYFTDDAKGVESVDHDSNDKECGKNGGAWVTGYTDSSYIAEASNGNWNIGSYDKDNVYFTQVMTPDQSASGVSNFFGFSCSGGSSCQVGSASADRSDLQEQLSPTGGSVFAMLQWAVKQTNGVPFGQDQSFGNGSGWCGKGGSGVPVASGWACMAHDYNYERSGNSWPGHNADPTQSWQGGPQLQRINQQLCTHTSNILIQEFFSQGYNSTLGIGSTWGCQ